MPPLEHIEIHKVAGGRGYELEVVQELPQPIEEIFAYFSDATKLEEITPPWLQFHVVTPRPIEIAAGTRIDYRLRVHGLPLRWQSLISAWEPPYRFVDEQVRGPYRRWVHEHTFEPRGEVTRVRDRVDYQVPFGALAHELVVKRDLRKIFQYRLNKLAETFGRAAANA